MKPVDQTTFGFPTGNCFSACVASLLEIGIDQVPFFMSEPTDAWWERFFDWLKPRGFWAVSFKLGGGEWRPQGLCILSGRSPRRPDHPEDESMHSVVANGDDIVWDPHPSRAGILSKVDVILLVPTDPARLAGEWSRA